MTLNHLNDLDNESLRTALTKCCGSSKWVEKLSAYQPFESEMELLEQAGRVWREDCGEADWLEAFGHHPKIGDIKSLEKKFANTKEWSGQEQAGVNVASREVLQALATGNEAYEEKFGYIFIVCATGKTAREMLDLLKERLPNDPQKELLIAMEEQAKITTIRLKKLLS